MPETIEQTWLTRISEETELHRTHLASIGLDDRAHYFKVRPFIYQDCIYETVNISRFNHIMDLPEVARIFDPHEPNTLFVNSEANDHDQEQEIKKALDIRLYPTIRRLIEEKSTTIFLGSKVELQAYTNSKHEKLIIEVEVPSSVKFYLTLTPAHEIKVYIANLVSHENLIQQLITLKLADMNLEHIPILGDTQYYKLICQQDLLAFKEKTASYLASRNVLIVAGCSLEETACSTLEQIFNGKVQKEKFCGDLVSLTYLQSKYTPNLGFIILNLNYGEICEEQVAIILEKFNCIGVFSGSAAGFIPKTTDEELPRIGSRMPVHAAKHYSGELIKVGEKTTHLHLQVPTIFTETFSWLKNAVESEARTVDVETFYILRAIQRYRQVNPHLKLDTDIGVFISDYVGTKPLRSYHEVFAQYPSILQNFIEQVLVANVASTYNNNRSTTPSFTSGFFTITPEHITIGENLKKEAVIDCIGKTWKKSEFNERVHTPVTIDTVNDKAAFTAQHPPRCLHLPIKLPGSDIRIPNEYRQFLEILQKILNFEMTANPYWEEVYALLTVDAGRVQKNKSQRVEGLHVDGMPRDRDNPEAQLADHAYLVTNALPTTFYPQKFNMDPYDPKIHHFFAIFRALADESRTITAKPYDIIIMGPYTVHTPTLTQEDVDRIFVRVEFSTLPFDRIGNSVNPYFLNDSRFPFYPFNYVPRPIPKHLFVPPEVYANKPITNEDYVVEQLDNFGRAILRATFVKSDKFKFKHSDYKSLNLIAEQIMNEEFSGMVLTHKGQPHAFLLYKVENKTVKLDTLFTLSSGKGQEIMIYQMKVLKKLSDRLSLQAGFEEGANPVTIEVNENNKDMVRYFLRAARLAKIEVNIDDVSCREPNIPQRSNNRLYSLKELCMFTIHTNRIPWQNANLSIELENELMRVNVK